MPQPWAFYGRKAEQKLLADIVDRGRWFFLKITGRRRIGKTTLANQVLRDKIPPERLFYCQIPDSDPAGVLSVVQDFYRLFRLPKTPPTDLRGLARSFGELAKEGYVVAIDEFQYFHRKALYEFTSHLQYEVDRLAQNPGSAKGGLIVLGSIHTEMTAILEDRSAPLFNRITDQIDLPHLDIASVLEILRTHTDASPARLLFLWNLFEGVPKFYRDCYEQGVLGADPKTVLEKMFFSSSSPLKSEADNWFLRELRGRTDLVLKYVAYHPGCSSGDVRAHASVVEPSSEKQVEAYIRILLDRYQMLERLQPIFAPKGARQGRLYVRDNFLRTWLAALAVPAAAVNFRAVELLVNEAASRLEDAEGHGLERLVWTLYEERSRKGIGDFSLTSRIQGYWDRSDTEIDLVALDEVNNTIRLGSCKRNAEKLIADLPTFDGHVGRFLDAFPQYKTWRVEKVAIAPEHSEDTRRAAAAEGYVAQDLNDLTTGL